MFILTIQFCQYWAYGRHRGLPSKTRDLLFQIWDNRFSDEELYEVFLSMLNTQNSHLTLNNTFYLDFLSLIRQYFSCLARRIVCSNGRMLELYVSRHQSCRFRKTSCKVTCHHVIYHTPFSFKVDLSQLNPDATEFKPSWLQTTTPSNNPSEVQRQH